MESIPDASVGWGKESREPFLIVSAAVCLSNWWEFDKEEAYARLAQLPGARRQDIR